MIKPCHSRAIQAPTGANPVIGLSGENTTVKTMYSPNQACPSNPPLFWRFSWSLSATPISALKRLLRPFHNEHYVQQLVSVKKHLLVAQG